MKELLFYSTYPEMTALARQVSRELHIDCEIKEINGSCNMGDINLSAGENTRVVVSRGGASRWFKESTTIPVVDVTVNFGDILQAVSNVIARGGRHILFMANSRVISGMGNEIFKLGGVDFRIKTFDSYSTVEDRRRIQNEVKSMVKCGEVDAIIRDAMALPEVEQYIPVCLIQSSRESIREAFLEGKRLLNTLKVEETKRVEIETILNHIPSCIITIDNDFRIKTCNNAAAKEFNREKDSIIGSDLNVLLQEVSPSGQANQDITKKNLIIEPYGKKMVLSNTPVIVDNKQQGSIVMINNVANIQDQEMSIRRKLHEQGLTARYHFEDIQGSSQAMKNLKQRAQRFADTDEIILITGETGTGKELFAHSIHNSSKVADGPFVSINCAAFNDNLLDSELFGYEPGTFTGGLKNGKKGLFEIAHRGTIFLDEISKTSLAFQSKLLRVLQEKCIRRSGGYNSTPVDVRVICSANKELKEQTARGEFLEDLYYRISVLLIKLIPLRERPQDILDLTYQIISEQAPKKQNKRLVEQG